MFRQIASLWRDSTRLLSNMGMRCPIPLCNVATHTQDGQRASKTFSAAEGSQSFTWLSHAWLQPLESGAIQSCSWLETAQILNIMLHMPWNIGCVVVHVHGLVIVEMCIGQWLYLVVWVHSWHLHCVGLHSSTSVLLCGYMLTPWCCCV